VKISFGAVSIFLNGQVKLGFGTGIIGLFGIILAKTDVTIRRSGRSLNNFIKIGQSSFGIIA